MYLLSQSDNKPVECISSRIEKQDCLTLSIGNDLVFIS